MDTAVAKPAKIKQLLASAVAAGASDIHINVGMPPVLRINTEIIVSDHEPITQDAAKQMLLEMIGAERYAIFEQKLDYDFSTTIDDQSRFRGNAHLQRETIAMSFRLVPKDIPVIDELNLPPIVAELAKLPRGLVLVTGHTGSGKSTTLASMIGLINSTVSERIITLEDPVEYVFENDKSMIEQREIGCDCLDFASGLRHALRQDPDTILVGEMRDLETTGATVTAAETGHLVLSTLHTINAAQTVERIIDIYPSGQQNQIRAMLANTLQAVISQTLFKRADTPGMVPCVEIMLCTSAVRNCIRENRIFELPNIIATSRKIGMQDMDTSIADMYFKGFISREDAITCSTQPQKMDTILTEDNKVNYLRKLKQHQIPNTKY